MDLKRAIVLVLDGVGAGEAPDAASFGDNDHPSTLEHVWQAAGGIDAPNLARIGLFEAGGIDSGAAITGRWGRLQEMSQGGKDSVTGHWEMAGIVVDRPFPTYPQGFPIALIKAFESAIGTQTLANRPASGTEIIATMGALHEETGFPIVYTSADSVFQIACHEAVVPIEDLYGMCRTARDLCVEPNNVQRVIARPFEGDAKGGYRRTERRKDYPLVPPRNLVDVVGDVLGIGVVPELFGGRGFRPTKRTQSNAEHEVALFEALESDARFIFGNFEDFDMLYGHRNDPMGFAQCLERFDATLGKLLEVLRPGDLLVITADHGNDPTSASTDHSREFVPACLAGAGVEPGGFGDVQGMGAIGATVAKHLGVDWACGTALI